MEAHETEWFHKGMDNLVWAKHHVVGWDMIFTNCPSDIGLISKIYKELFKKNATKETTHLKIG